MEKYGMTLYREKLPQLSEKIFITDGGLETELVFHHQIDLPEFAAYPLLKDDKGTQLLFDYYKKYALLGKKYQQGLILETPTWRANPDWGKKIGDDHQMLETINRKSVELISEVRQQYSTQDSPIVISGCIGPRGDGYNPDKIMTITEATDYHTIQLATFSKTQVDMVAALTLNYVNEAIGVTLAAQALQLPVCISFTLETDGLLPTGESLQQAIRLVDEATNSGPAYYMINCAHPSHFEHLFSDATAPWLKRVKGLRCNASCLSHAELDECEVLDEGNPLEFGLQISKLREKSPHLTVLGGCCGSDSRHIEEICKAVA